MMKDWDKNQDVMQVCLNGHQITDSYLRSPHLAEDYCQKCGKETIVACPNCQTPIKGDYYYPGVVDLTGFRTPVPKRCSNCGKYYPWGKKLEKVQRSKSGSSWLLTSLYTALGTGAFVVYFALRFPRFELLDLFILIVGLVFTVMLLRNPKNRFYRTGGALLTSGAFSHIIPSLVIAYKNTSKAGSETLQLSLNNIHPAIPITMIIAGTIIYSLGGYFEQQGKKRR
ncbi:DUF2321 domain-containing protein [Microscilla marina]|uniref:Uncharacterized protein n=1 Tax=Microscilla marina ATCC 23134 TaxID=313606 RepID=A1ZK27_MICM2|nr:DUF2321 domain-containing protein [Microscilla marina]EAY29480.1 hypothetical protein M23134_01540 [Microscilla marina ATCC 23134]